MYKPFLLFFLISLITTTVRAQGISISGNVADTTLNLPVKNAVIIAVRVKDSILISYTRSDDKGLFKLENLPVDTLEIIISHPQFGDRSYFLFGSSTNNIFDFGKVILPPKSNQLKEVVIYATKDPVYFNGDTLVYTADAYKLKENATVEDLLKKLPGIQVDAQGKITSQGKAISQVLVDGDEFFGSDPTVATKNLGATAVESVQVYEKKNEAATSSSEETVQVMNLKLKEDSKKGYFGKASAGSDFNRFYEGEVLANRFTSKQKISVFALASNTPRAGFGHSDMYKYGLDNENSFSMSDNGDFSFSDNSRQNQGLPKTLKTGFYFNDKLGKKTKLGLNYTYNSNELLITDTTQSSYFLTDTNYITATTRTNAQKSQGHQLNFKITQTIDSLTTLEIEPRLKWNTSEQANYQLTKFITALGSLANQTEIATTNKAEGYDINTLARLNRNFKKRDRILRVTYNFVKTDNNAQGVLKSFGTFSDTPGKKDSIDQQKIATSINQVQNASAFYTEPLTKKLKLELEYNYDYTLGKQNKTAKNLYNGEYAQVDSIFSNNFESNRVINRLGARLTFETKKIRSYAGMRIRNVSNTYTDLFHQIQIKQSINNLLPYVNYTYNFKQGTRVFLNYTTASNQPTINQLQPVPDNTNPNQIKLGNPNLKPTFNQNFNLSFQSFKPISGQYIMCNLNFSTVNNAFANSIFYDEFGRTQTQTINVNGNYNAGASLRGGIPFFAKKLSLRPNVSYNYGSYSSLINTQKNSTTTAATNLGLGMELDLDSLVINAGYTYNHTSPNSTLNQISNQAYSQHQYNASVYIKLPYKFILNTDANYYVNNQRAYGYNLRYILWNASLSKAFLKNENVLLTLSCNDILNQNIATSRTVEDNVITDKKSNIVARYFLLTLTYKFNSTKTKADDDDF